MDAGRDACNTSYRGRYFSPSKPTMHKLILNPTPTEILKVRRAMTKSLEKAAHKIIGIVNRDKDHIPPITTTDANPFPYQVVVNPKAAPEPTWGPRMGIF